MSGGKGILKVELPLESFDECARCSKTTNLRLCSSCAEKIYCSPECQKSDWPSHKLMCKTIERVDLSSFYPFIASIICRSHMRNDKPTHPALRHRIINSPNPGAKASLLPDGSWAKLVVLGDPIEQTQIGDESWWPTAMSPAVRSKLLRRIIQEGMILPILTATCFALLTEMHTNPSAEGDCRPRLNYRSSPVTDFGIATGSADVQVQDRLAYYQPSEKIFQRGQDPDDHYWLYFTTIRGENIILDCAMFTFNMCLVVTDEPYVPPGMGMGCSPAYFGERELAQVSKDLQNERRRVSALRDPLLQSLALRNRDGFQNMKEDVLSAFMKRVSGKAPTEEEVHFAASLCFVNCDLLLWGLEEKKWRSFPPKPTLGIEKDPDELEPKNDGDDWFSGFVKYTRRYKKGEITREQLRKVVERYSYVPSQGSASARQD